jgi:DNA-binding MarR family transcriptional regulator
MATGYKYKVKEIAGAVRRLYRAVYQDYSKTIYKYDITGSQSSVLRLLFHNGPLSSADLSRKLYVKPSNITGIIDRLEKKTLVERIRKKDDRRVVLINLTEAGSELSRVLPDPIEEKLISGLGHLEEDELEQISKIMMQVLNIINKSGFQELSVEMSRENNGVQKIKTG